MSSGLSAPSAGVWDFVALFAPGARWDGGPPDLRCHGYPVVDAIDGLRTALRP